MTTTWYYRRDHETHGPVSEEQLKRLASEGLLDPEDLLWPEGSTQDHAVAACSALRFERPQERAAAIPDWLKGQIPAAGSTPEAASDEAAAIHWLADLINLESPLRVDDAQQEEPPGHDSPTVELILPESPAAEFAAAAEREPVPTSPLPDWLEMMPESEEPDPPPTGLPDWLAEVTQPTVPQPASTTDNLLPPGTESIDVELVSGPTTHAEAEIAEIEAPTSDDSGFNPDTGLVEDAQKFQRWQILQQHQRTEEAGPDILEVFRKARKEVEDWVDREDNQDRLVNDSLQSMHEDEEIKAMVHRYRGYGPEMAEKLYQHLDFMVENRRKYYAAREGLSSHETDPEEAPQAEPEA